MAAYVFCLRHADADNWEICKRDGLIGVRRSASGMKSAREVDPGDKIYVWRGGAGRPGAGLLARVKVVEAARPATSVPWPDPDSYTYVIPVELEEELTEPIPDSHPGNGKGIRFRIENTDLQKSLRPLSSESELLLAQCFAPTAVSLQDDLAVALPHGWSTDQALIKAVEEAAVAAARKHLVRDGWREIRDCQKDGCGYDLLYEHSDGRRRLVEVKGTAAPEVRFQLTRLEHEVLSRDPSGRIYVVVDALNAASVHVLDWTEVEELGVRPAAWQVG
jgi:hypothetical protein